MKHGSQFIQDYLAALSDDRAIWQPVWMTEVGTTVQNDPEIVTYNYTVDYLSLANRDIMVEAEGEYVTRYTYGADGARLSAEYDYADGTAPGESGENIVTDMAANDVSKIYYRRSLLDSTLFAVDEDGEVLVHMIYDAWGDPQTETKLDANFAGIDNLNNFTGYTYDETLGLYFAQNRFYNAETHRFTQEDPVKDGENWYVYCANNPGIFSDFWGLNPTDDLLGKAINTYSNIITYNGKKYVNARHIFSNLIAREKIQYDSTTSTAVFTAAFANNEITIKANQKNGYRQGESRYYYASVYSGRNYLGSANMINFEGHNYIAHNDLLNYFEQVWCASKYVAVMLLNHSRGAAGQGHMALLLKTENGRAEVYSFAGQASAEVIVDRDVNGYLATAVREDNRIFTETDTDYDKFVKTGIVYTDLIDNHEGDPTKDTYNRGVYIPISHEQGLKMHDKARQLRFNPGKYNLYSRNCGQIARAILEAGGITVLSDDKWTVDEVRPNSTYDYIERKIKNGDTQYQDWRIMKFPE